MTFQSRGAPLPLEHLARQPTLVFFSSFRFDERSEFLVTKIQQPEPYRQRSTYMDNVLPATCRQASIRLFGRARRPGEVEDDLQVALSVAGAVVQKWA